MVRKSSLFLGFVAGSLLFSGLVAIHARKRTEADLPFLREKAVMIRELGLTDLCLFTEASYTRHPTQSDLRTPFQDSPLALEHFPTGTLLGPPALVRNTHGIPD